MTASKLSCLQRIIVTDDCYWWPSLMFSLLETVLIHGRLRVTLITDGFLELALMEPHISDPERETVGITGWADALGTAVMWGYELVLVVIVNETMTEFSSFSCWRHCLEYCRTFSGVKTHDLTLLVSSGDDGACALLPSWRRRYWRTFLAVWVLSMVVVVLQLVWAADHVGGAFSFLSFFFLFLFGCVHLWCLD